MNEEEINFIKEKLEDNSIKNHDCIEWKGPFNPGGYGSLYIFRKNWLTHRLSYLIKHGEIPEGLFICHKCNNKKCLNPDHLYAGTPKQNSEDLKNSDLMRKYIQERKIRKEQRQIERLSEYFTDKNDSLITVEDFSIIVSCHINTVYKAIKNGHIQAFRVGVGKRSSFRIPSSEIQRMAKFNLETIIKGITSGRSVLT